MLAVHGGGGALPAGPRVPHRPGHRLRVPGALHIVIVTVMASVMATVIEDKVMASVVMANVMATIMVT